MKKFFSLLATLVAISAFADPETNQVATAPSPSLTETNKVATAPSPLPAEPAPERAATEAAAPLAEQNVDEIDLEEVDDSAEAAKRPTVKSSDDKSAAVSLVDIDCDNATLEDILRQFRKTTGANIISATSTNLLRRVSVSLRRVPWKDALQAMLNTRGFRLEERGDIYFVSEDKQLIPILTRTFELKHASCTELTELFNANYAAKDARGNTIRPIANAFPGANAVVVCAPETVLNDCAQIIKAVDKATSQIYIEARFMELSTESLHKLGLQWNSLESWGASVKDLNGGLSFQYDRNKDTTRTASGGTWTEDVKSLASFASASSFSGQLSADDFRLALSAFESLQDARIFSNPKVIVSNGKKAIVDMTTKFPYVKLTSSRNSSATASYLDISAQMDVIPGSKDKQKDKEDREKVKEPELDNANLFAGDAFFSWGIVLSVKPRISPDGLISVEIVPTLSQLATDSFENGFYEISSGSSDTPIGQFPVLDMKRILTEFTMKDGSTAVIGGLSRTTEEDVDTGIPYLRKIPYIGQKLFGWKSRQKVQKEVIICVTVGIANPADIPKDIGLPKNAIMGREYTTGLKLEPGDREGPAAKVLAIDTTDGEFRVQADQGRAAHMGTIKITPVK